MGKGFYEEHLLLRNTPRARALPLLAVVSSGPALRAGPPKQVVVLEPSPEHLVCPGSRVTNLLCYIGSYEKILYATEENFGKLR